ALIVRGILAAPSIWNYLRRLRRAIRQIAPDIIHSNGLKSHLMIGLARVRLPTVWHIHDFVSARPVIAGLLRRVAGCTMPVAISHAVAHDIVKWLPGSSPRVVLNGIDLDRFSGGPGNP